MISRLQTLLLVWASANLELVQTQPFFFAWLVEGRPASNNSYLALELVPSNLKLSDFIITIFEEKTPIMRPKLVGKFLFRKKTWISVTWSNILLFKSIRYWKVTQKYISFDGSRYLLGAKDSHQSSYHETSWNTFCLQENAR